MRERPAETFVTPLRARGYAVLPQPRRVELDGGQVWVGPDWKIECRGVGDDDIAVEQLYAAAAGVESFMLGGAMPGDLVLTVEDRAVDLPDGVDPLCVPQAYRLTICEGRVDLAANGRPGLFYGIQTLLQLLGGDGERRFTLPTGVIEDWPSYPLRIVHWDTKHHQDRPETLRRFIDQLAAFKVNAVAFELEDKFEYPSHPVVAAPGAFTTKQLQELVDYALARHIQIIPNVQAPAHMTWVLKHDEFAHLRCDGNNYQICMDEPEARRLIFDLYDDVLAATRGVDYFLVSTDEVYYAGICEKHRSPYNPENRGATWCDFANAANRYLRERGRRCIMWVEWPLRAEDVRLLDDDIIDGVIGTDDVAEQLRIENEKGMRQLCYVSMQGAEPLVPNYFPSPLGKPEAGRLADAWHTTLAGKATGGNPIGTFSAAWDDSGLHNELFWPGWGMMAQCSWMPGGATVAQGSADFMDVFYGREVEGMADAWRDLQRGARYWEHAWDREASLERTAAYGNSERKFSYPRRDTRLSPPPLPALPDIQVAAEFAPRYASLLQELPAELERNERMLGRLQAALTRVGRNRYNIEVLLSIGHHLRHFLDMLGTLQRAERTLLDASAAHDQAEHQKAVNLLGRAHDAVAATVDDLHRTYRSLKTVWERSRYEKGRSVDGRHFLHVMDDVKDHQADRRPDLTYLIAPTQRIGLEQWCADLAAIIAQYSQTHGVSVTITSPHV